MGKSMFNKYNKYLGIIILGIVLVVYILFMTVTGRVFDVGKTTIAANTSEDTEYTVGRISNDREYSIVVDRKVSNLKSISLKIKDLKEKYTQEKRNDGIITIKFYDNESGKTLGEKELEVQGILLTTYYAEESSDSSAAYSNIECRELNINVDSLKIVIKGKNIPQDSELVVYGNRQNKIEKMTSYDDSMKINGNILCTIVEGRKKISTDFLWGLVLIAFIGITANFIKMKSNTNGGPNGKKNNK